MRHFAYMLPALSLTAIVCYLLATGLLAWPLFGSGAGKPSPVWQRAALAVALLAVLAHAGVLLGMHRGALDLHFFAALSLVACVVSAITMLVSITRPVAALGVVVFPLAALFVAIDQLSRPTPPEPMDWQIKLHVAIGVVAFSVLSFAAVLALGLAVQERALRHRQFRPWLRALPPLTQTETLLFRLIGAGFALLTLTLLSGALFVHDIRNQHLAHVIVLTLVAWVIFGVLLWGRWRHGWRGTRAVNLTLIGMAVLGLAFFGSKFVLEVVLQRVP